MPGPVDPETGILYNPPNLPGWDRFSLKPVFEQEFGVSVFVGNDANCAALAEHRYGAGRGHRHVIYLTVSTGIGGGIIIDNKLFAGRSGFGAELGHMTIDRNGPQDNCGNVGCLEALASGTAVGRMGRERLLSGETSSMLGLAGGVIENVNARVVSDAALAGDSVAMSIMQEVATNLGIGVVSILHAFDPDVIIIGGGMSNSLDQLLPGINAEIDRHSMGNFHGRRPIVKSELGDDVGILGAAALVFSGLEGD
jgi:glucokinase